MVCELSNSRLNLEQIHFFLIHLIFTFHQYLEPVLGWNGVGEGWVQHELRVVIVKKDLVGVTLRVSSHWVPSNVSTGTCKYTLLALMFVSCEVTYLEKC